MPTDQSTGFLIVNVSSARGAIPLEGATVTVYYDEPDNSSVFSVLTTDTSGKTERLELPAPPRSLSETPGNSKPYATYTVQTNKDGYYTITNAKVPIFAEVTSIQPVEMLPLSEYDSDKIYPRFGMDSSTETSPNL